MEIDERRLPFDSLVRTAAVIVENPAAKNEIDGHERDRQGVQRLFAAAYFHVKNYTGNSADEISARRAAFLMV